MQTMRGWAFMWQRLKVSLHYMVTSARWVEILNNFYFVISGHLRIGGLVADVRPHNWGRLVVVLVYSILLM